MRPSTPPIEPGTIETRFLDHGFVSTRAVSKALYLADALGLARRP